VSAILRWRPSDPGRFALRQAVRTGIVMPVALALGNATGDEQTALFAAFGAFAMLVFVDFGGPLAVRALAYLTLAVFCSGLIALGTVCSNEPVLGAAVMLVVGFAILFSGVLNGYFAAAASAALLAFVLPAMVPGDASVIGARLGGWWIAAGLSVPASLFLLAARPRDRLRASVAEACRTLAAYVRTPTQDAERALTTAVDAMHERFAGTPFRPTGPTGATGALAAMIDELDWLRGVALRPASTDAVLDPTPGEVALRDISADALIASAALVAGRSMQPPDRDALERGRARVFEELLGQIGDPAVRDDDALLWSALQRAWDVRVISFLTRDLADRALLAGGTATAGGGPRWLRFVRRQGVALAASGRVAAAHAGVRSIWFRNSLRGAVGLALAVFVAGEASVQHAFWVVLGSLSVLRSSALNTGASVVQALLGTLIGILAGGLLVYAIGGDETGLWIALPFAAMLAAYAPRAVSFAAGQAGFTVAILVIFNLLAPSGWQVGLIRLEDVSIGFAISLGVGLLFWPRGAAALLRRTLDDALATAAGYVRGAFGRLATGTSAAPVDEQSTKALAAWGRLDAAFRQRLSERASHDPRLPAHTRLISIAVRLRGTGDAMQYLSTWLGATPRPPEASALIGDAGALARWYADLGQSVSAMREPQRGAPADPALHPALLAAVRSSHATGDRDRLIAGAAMAWAGLHLDALRALEDRSAQAAADLIDGVR